MAIYYSGPGWNVLSFQSFLWVTANLHELLRSIHPKNVSSPRRLASDLGTWLENSTSPLETSRYIMQNNYYAKKLLWMSGVTFLV